MAKKRMLSQEIIYDEVLNSLSLEAQYLFPRLLVIADDCGIIPGNLYTLRALINPHEKIKLESVLQEILSAGILLEFEHDSKTYFSFKRDSFDENQAYLIKNRRKSEYMKISSEEFLSLSITFRNIPKYSETFSETTNLTHREIKAKSNKLKEKRYSIPPSMEDVQARCIEMKYDVMEAEKFYNHYQSNGWKVGKNSMKDWHASLAGWNSRNQKAGGVNGTVKPKTILN